MDPLSIITGALTISGALVGTLNLLRSAYGASVEIQSLIKEVSDFEILLKHIKPIVLLINRPEVNRFLEDGKNKLDELQSIVSRCVEEKCTGPAKVRRARWMRMKSTTATLRTDIQRVNSNLTLLLIVDTRQATLILNTLSEPESIPIFPY